MTGNLILRGTFYAVDEDTADLQAPVEDQDIRALTGL